MHKNLRISDNCRIFASEKETKKQIKPQDPEGHQDYEDYSKRNDSNRLHG